MVPREDIGRFWPHMEPHIQAALAYSAGEFWPEDIRANLEAGAWQAWGAVTPEDGLLACATTEIMDYPRARILFLQFAGGQEGRAVAALWPLVRTWARAQGCAAMRFMGRRGWARSGMLPGEHRILQDSIVIPVEG